MIFRIELSKKKNRIEIKKPYDNVKLTYFRLNLVLLIYKGGTSSRLFYLFFDKVENFSTAMKKSHGILI